MAPKEKVIRRGKRVKNLPDGREIWTQQQAGEYLGVSGQRVKDLVRNGTFTDLLNLHQIQGVIREEIEEHKAEAGCGNKTEAERSTKTKLARAKANVLKYHAKLCNVAQPLIVADDAIKTCGAMSKQLTSELSKWRPAFFDGLDEIGVEFFSGEVTHAVNELQDSLSSAVETPKSAISPRDRSLLEISVAPQNQKVLIKANNDLDAIKTDITLIEFHQETGSFVERADVYHEVRRVGAILSTQIRNIAPRVLGNIAEDRKSDLKPELRSFTLSLMENMKALATQKGIDAAMIERLLKGLEPPEEMLLSDWADQNRVMSAVSSQAPGKWRTDKTPHLREPMNIMGGADPTVKKVTLMFGAQTGKSEAVINLIAFSIARPAGGPCLMVQPSDTLAHQFATQRMNEVWNIPAIAEKVVNSESSVSKKTGRTTQSALSRTFTDASFSVVSAGSPTNLASRPVRVLVIDESDRMSVTKEGDPVALAEERTNSFSEGDMMMVVTSTPGLKATSRVNRSFLAGDQRYRYCPCPHCGESHILDFDNICWDGKEDGVAVSEIEPKDAYYACPECGSIWTDSERKIANAKGKWIPHNPNVKHHRSYHMNSLGSPFLSLYNHVEKMIEASKSPELEQTFVNTRKALPWSDDTSNLAEDDIIERMEGSTYSLELIDEEILLLTAGVDVQSNRLEVSILGHCSDGNLCFLGHKVLEGDPSRSDSPVWTDLKRFARQKFQHALGNEIGIEAVGIDSGYQTTAVQEFVHKNSTWAYSVKGVAGEDRAVWKRSDRRQKNNWSLYQVGVDQAKTHLLTLIANQDPNKAQAFFADMDQWSDYTPAVWAEQLLSEYVTTTYPKGMPKRTWIRKAGRNAEILDTNVYAYAVKASLSVPNWDARRARLTRKPPDSATEDEFDFPVMNN